MRRARPALTLVSEGSSDEANNPGPGGQGDLTPGQRIAIGLPRRADVRGPEQYPGVPQLEGAFELRDATSSRVYAGRRITSPGPRTISFVAPSAESSYEVLMAKAPQRQSLAAVPFLAGAGTTAQPLQVMTAPMVGAPVFNGRPPDDFTGTLPYAGELFGVYQPPAGWFGQHGSLRAARALADERPARLGGGAFAGQAARALDDEGWRRSPSGSTPSRKVEESLTEQDDLADAVKEDNVPTSGPCIRRLGGSGARGASHSPESGEAHPRDGPRAAGPADDGAEGGVRRGQRPVSGSRMSRRTSMP